MSEAQLLAVGLTAGLAFLMILAAVRWRLPSVPVVFVLIFGLPAVGFASYAITGGPTPDLTIAVVLAIILYALGLAVAGYSIVRRIKRPKPTVWNMTTDVRRYTVALAARWVMVLWVSSLLFLFEPGFAVANVLLSALWMIVWLPARFRTFGARSDIDIAAPASRVFEFISDVRNWVRYRDAVELVSVAPDGPLEIGTEYVGRVRIPESLRRTSIRQVESRYRVVAMVPGKSFDIEMQDQSGTAHTEVNATPTGARLTRTTVSTMGLLRAWSADMLNVRRAQSALRAYDLRDGVRLKQILENGSGQ